MDGGAMGVTNAAEGSFEIHPVIFWLFLLLDVKPKEFRFLNPGNFSKIT
jgi:hypothetical protein